MALIENMAARRVFATTIFTCLAVSGCGTAEYNRRYDEKMKELWHLEPFLQLNDKPTAIALSDDAKDAASAQLRLPKVFDEKAKRYEPSTTGDEPIDPERMLPPFVRSLPHFRFSYEHFGGRTGQTDKLPIYFYACATQSSREPFESALRKALAKSYKGTELEWKSSKCDTPDESKIKWRRASVSLGGQTFATQTGEEIEKKELDGTVEIFIHSDDDRHVMFILRMPNDLEETIDLRQLAKAVAGTLTWSEPEASDE